MGEKEPFRVEGFLQIDNGAKNVDLRVPAFADD